MLDWYDAQERCVNSLELEERGDELFYDEKILELREVIPYEKKKLISDNARIKLYGDRAELMLDSELQLGEYRALKPEELEILNNA